MAVVVTGSLTHPFILWGKISRLRTSTHSIWTTVMREAVATGPWLCHTPFPCPPTQSAKLGKFCLFFPVPSVHVWITASSTGRLQEGHQRSLLSSARDEVCQMRCDITGPC